MRAWIKGGHHPRTDVDVQNGLPAASGRDACRLPGGLFFDNGKVTVGKIVDSWSERTRAAVAGRHVLAIHDTTEVHFSTKPKRRRGLGQCGHGNAYGLLAHVMMAVDADSTACLGLVTGQIW